MDNYVGQHLPDVTVYEFISENNTMSQCQPGPKAWQIPDLAHKKKVIIVGVIGAFTPICDGNHIPGFIQHYQDFMDKGIDELWCLSTNDIFVMKAWGKQLGAENKMRMLSDGSLSLVMALDLTLDLTCRGMGVRSDRFAMVVKNGQIVDFLREGPGQFCLTDAATLLARLASKS